MTKKITEEQLKGYLQKAESAADFSDFLKKADLHLPKDFETIKAISEATYGPGRGAPKMILGKNGSVSIEFAGTGDGGDGKEIDGKFYGFYSECKYHLDSKGKPIEAKDFKPVKVSDATEYKMEAFLVDVNSKQQAYQSPLSLNAKQNLPMKPDIGLA